MRSLPFLLIALTILIFLGFKATEHPHGEDFKISCGTCHSPQGWKLDKSIYSYKHDEVFELTGSHAELSCKQCHQSLVFKDVDNQCFECHSDMHENTVGSDCERCHNTSSWLVTNITELHQDSRFPLLGIHRQTDCQQCHTGSNFLRFEPLSTDCYNCHQADYVQTTTPSHLASGFSQECSDCHTVFTASWTGSFNHHFFPLQQAHDLPECTDCHEDLNYSGLQPDCLSCHEDVYLATTDPNHVQASFGEDCLMCHTLAPDWKPTHFDHDGQYFPIYSGKHQGEWTSCKDCHTTGSFESFHCLDCHEHNKADMDSEHGGVFGYKYDTNRCIICHPNA